MADLHVERLRTFVNDRVRRNGCDHSFRFTEEWAAGESIDFHDLLDALEANAGFCDCEVVLNLPDEIDLYTWARTTAVVEANPWLIPTGFECTESARFSKVIVCQAGIARNTYSTDGELLIPAPKGAKPRRRVRKSVNFFLGCSSGMPSEYGVVRNCAEVSVLDFARQVASSGIEELVRFTSREAAFVLSKIASLKPSLPVGTYFTERFGIASKREELTVHRVFFRG